MAALAFSAVTAARAASASSTSPSTNLLRVAFASSTRGVGLFLTAAGRYPGRCLLYTRSTENAGRSFGAKGAPLVRWRCGDGEPFSAITISGGALIAYGPRLAVSHDMGRTWTSPTVPGGVAALATHGQVAWALVTRCRQGAQRCRLRLYESTNGGGTWQPAVSQPPSDEVDGMVALAAESGASALLAVAPDGAPVLALPTPPRGRFFSLRPTAAVDRLQPGSSRWTTQTVTCAPGTSELSIGSDGSYWLACAGEPGAGSQLKSLATSTDGGKRWRTIPGGCGVTGSACHSALEVAGYLGGCSR